MCAKILCGAKRGWVKPAGKAHKDAILPEWQDLKGWRSYLLAGQCPNPLLCSHRIERWLRGRVNTEAAITGPRMA